MAISIIESCALSAVAAVVVYAWQEARRRTLETRLRAELAAQAQELMRLTAENGALAEARDSLDRQRLDQKQWIEQQTRYLHDRLAATAAQLLEEKSERFTALNRRELDQLVTPFRDQLAEFRRRVDELHTHDTRERGELSARIESLTALNQNVAQQALQLANALTINNRVTGTWGEMVLRRVLEDAGLHEGREYRLQHSIESSVGEDQRPDAILFLPEDRQLVIDSKVSNKAWVEYCEAADETARSQALAQHVASLRAHMKGLARRDYARSPELKGADFVLMFVPVEAALLAALAQDPALYGDGYRNRIIFVTPSTLLAVARLVEGLWIVEKRQRSADEIAEAARKLYDKLAGFAVSFLAVGDALQTAEKAFNQARGQLSEGPGNAVRLAERLKDLGVQPGKSLPEELLRDALRGEDPEEGDAGSREQEPPQESEVGARGQAR